MNVKVVSWNIDKRRGAWEELLDMDADVALLQEVGVVPQWVRDWGGVGIGPREHWDSHTWLAGDKLFDRWPMVVKLSDRVQVEWFKQVAPMMLTGEDEFAVSGIGTVAAAKVVPRTGQPFVVVSMYGRWIRWHPTVKSSWRVGYPDGAVHRIISDLSAFIGSYDPSKHRILAAGDETASRARFARRANKARAGGDAPNKPPTGPPRNTPGPRRSDPGCKEFGRCQLGVMFAIETSGAWNWRPPSGPWPRP